MSGTRWTLNSLYCQTEYEFKVRARGNGNNGYSTSWSGFRVKRQITGDYTPPTPTPTPTPKPQVDVSAPTGLSVQMTGSASGQQNCSATFTWDRPTGAVAYEYEAVLVGNEARNPQEPQPPHGPDNEWTFYGLWCSTEYDFRVKARGNGSDIWQGNIQPVIYTTDWSNWATYNATTFPFVPRPDRQPTFSVSTTEMFFHRGEMLVAKALPTATGGNGALTYSISPEPTNGVSFNETAHTLTVDGKQSAADVVTYTLTVEDTDDNVADTSINVSVFDLDVRADVSEYHTNATLESTNWGLLAYGNVRVTDSIRRARNYSVQIGFPRSAGFELNTWECAWPSGASSDILRSNWKSLAGSENVPLVRCGRGATAIYNIHIKVQFTEGGQTHEYDLLTFPARLESATHHVDNNATYHALSPWIDPVPPPHTPDYDNVTQNQLQTALDAAAGKWNSVSAPFAFALGSTSSYDILVRGYNQGYAGCSADSAIACTDWNLDSSGHVAGTMTIWFEFPAKSGPLPERGWTVDPKDLADQPERFYDLRSTILHELGHAASLAHALGSVPSIMVSNYTGATSIRSYDQSGIQALYEGHSAGPH